MFSTKKKNDLTENDFHALLTPTDMGMVDSKQANPISNNTKGLLQTYIQRRHPGEDITQLLVYESEQFATGQGWFSRAVFTPASPTAIKKIGDSRGPEHKNYYSKKVEAEQHAAWHLYRIFQDEDNDPMPSEGEDLEVWTTVSSPHRHSYQQANRYVAKSWKDVVWVLSPSVPPTDELLLDDYFHANAYWKLMSQLSVKAKEWGGKPSKTLVFVSGTQRGAMEEMRKITDAWWNEFLRPKQQALYDRRYYTKLDVAMKEMCI